MIATPNRPAARVLAPSDLMRLAPSIYAETPWGGMSDRYGFVPTSSVVAMFADRDYLPVRAEQSKSRIPGKSDFTQHMVRFRHADHLANPRTLGGEIPELVLVNSHDGATAYRIYAGIYRLVCLNGMVVCSAEFGGVSIRHTGGDDFAARVIEATGEVIGITSKAMDSIDRYKRITLDSAEREMFAAAALEARDATIELSPRSVLTSRRSDDASMDLWTTANVVQENLIRGGLAGRGSTGRRVRTRPINSVGEDIRLNAAIWRLTDRVANLIG